MVGIFYYKILYFWKYRGRLISSHFSTKQLVLIPPNEIETTDPNFLVKLSEIHFLRGQNIGEVGVYSPQTTRLGFSQGLGNF